MLTFDLIIRMRASAMALFQAKVWDGRLFDMGGLVLN